MQIGCRGRVVARIDDGNRAPAACGHILAGGDRASRGSGDQLVYAGERSGRLIARRGAVGIGDVGVDKEVIRMMAARLRNAGWRIDNSVSVENGFDARLSGSWGCHTETKGKPDYHCD